MVIQPALANAILEHIFQFDYALIQRVLREAGDVVDLVYVAEDLGTQQSLLLSPRTIRAMLLPRMTRIIELVHSFGKHVFHHDDGAIHPIIPDLLASGIDILNPIQWRCKGMEREVLARDFGSLVVFHGGIDNQETMPFGTPEEICAQVRENIELFSGGRGYIVAPCHNLQANTPTQNVVALYDAVHKFGQIGIRKYHL
jgi:uroporphyrinogen decarboxylase